VLESAMNVSKEAQTIDPAKLKPLLCSRCDYALDGLVINSTSVTCPECAFEQPVVAWDPDMLNQIDKPSPVFRILVYFGILILLLLITLIPEGMF